MKEFELNKAFTLIEPGPVVMVTTSYEGRHNIMTISWHMVMDFTPRFALLTGAWNYSFAALLKSKECVLAIPTVDLLLKTIGVGTSTGAEVDKFEKFGFTALDAKTVQAPLIGECYANIECKVVDHIAAHDIIVLDATQAWKDSNREEKRIFHYRGDGTFVADGEIFNHKKLMHDKLAPGI